MNTHLALIADDAQAHGLSADEARRRARLAFGNPLVYRERALDSVMASWFEHACRDVGLAARRLGRTPAFTLTVVLTLGAGIAGISLIFAIVNGVLLRPLPVRDQDQLLVAWTELRAGGVGHWPFRVTEIEAVRESSRLLEEVAGVSHNGGGAMVTVENGVASTMRVTPVMGDWFRVLGLDPILGRRLSRADDVPGAENGLVLTHRLWQRRYGGARDVIGRHLLMGERPFTIVGVMPPGADYPAGVEAWASIAAVTPNLSNAAFRIDVDLLARVRRGTTITQATDELRALVSHLDEAALAGMPRGRTPVVETFTHAVIGDVRSAMLILFGAVGLVLCVAGANVANLLLLRSEARRGEFALRAALGASRSQLARTVVAESVLLALAAGIAGLGLTWWTLQGVVALIPNGLPRVESIHMDATVNLFAVAAAFLVAAFAGTAPALLAARTDAAGQLRSGGQGRAGAVVRRSRRTLVVLQVALAVTVIVVAGLLTRSLWRLQTVDMGLAADRLVFVDLDLPQAKYADRERHLRFLTEMVGQLAAPEIAGATPVNVKPFAGSGGWELPAFTAETQSADRAVANPSLNLESVHPSYFQTFDVPVIRGRPFTQTDDGDAPRVGIVSEDVAAHIWPGDNPIGKRIKFGRPDSTNGWIEIIGIVKPTRYRELLVPRATLYLPAEQFLVAAHTLALRTTAPPAQVGALVRNRVALVDAEVHVVSVTSFGTILNEPLARPRFNALMTATFAGAALLLAGLGVYALLTASVRQRTHEIGIRVALGASPADVRGLVVREAMRVVGTGVVVGLLTALVLTRVVQSLLFNTSALDPVAMATAVLILVATSAFATYVPTRRAVRVDPIVLLKTV